MTTRQGQLARAKVRALSMQKNHATTDQQLVTDALNELVRWIELIEREAYAKERRSFP
jgi:hypothetical protein